MMSKLLSTFLFAFLVVAASATTTTSATAQTTLTGTFIIEKLASAPRCSPKATHKVKCTDIHLFADTGVNIAQWEGRVADVEYRLEVATCVTLRVTKIGAARYYLRISPYRGGQNRLGDRVDFRTRAPFLSIVPFVFASKAGFVPLGPFGTLSSDPVTLLWIKNDVALLGSARNIITIPNDTSLVDVEIIQQSAYLSINSSGPTGALLNVDCFTIKKP